MKKVIKSLIAIAIVLSPFLLGMTTVEADTASILRVSCAPTGSVSNGSKVTCKLFVNPSGVTRIEGSVSIEGLQPHSRGIIVSGTGVSVPAQSISNNVLNYDIRISGKGSTESMLLGQFELLATKDTTVPGAWTENVYYETVDDGSSSGSTCDPRGSELAYVKLYSIENDKLNKIDFTFDNDKKNYDLKVPYDTQNLVLAYWAQGQGGHGLSEGLQVDNSLVKNIELCQSSYGLCNTAVPLKGLKVGENTISITNTDKCGEKSTYTLNITRQSESESEGNGPAGNEDCTSGNCNGESGTVTKDGETVEVPDTATTVKIWYYIAGAVFMVFGVYLIVEARKMGKKQK